MDAQSKFAIHAACREGKRESITHTIGMDCWLTDTVQFQLSSLC